jgi:hypothetical protein
VSSILTSCFFGVIIMKKINRQGREYYYKETIGVDNYNYDIAIKVGERSAEVNISRFGVSIYFLDDGSCLLTDIFPSKLFPNNVSSLEKHQLINILNILEESSDEEIKSWIKLSADEINSLVEKWQRDNQI